MATYLNMCLFEHCMSLLTIGLFFIYCYGLGHGITLFLKQKDFVERQVMKVAIGLAALPLLGVILNVLRVPLDWRIIMLICLIGPAVSLLKRQFPSFKFVVKRSDITFIIVLLFVIFSLYMYAGGAFKYPWLEDGDPWSHALGVKYVAIEKNLNDDANALKFLDAYPPGYDFILGILHQTSPSLQWTLKFFNALIISLGLLFFYFFVKQLTSKSSIALFSTISLTFVPAYFSHFIWAHTLVVALMFPALYCLEKIKEQKLWSIPDQSPFLYDVEHPSKIRPSIVLPTIPEQVKIHPKKHQDEPAHIFFQIYTSLLLKRK